MERRVLKADELDAAVATLENWHVEGNALKKKLKFENFAEALAYVNRAGALAEAADHHPDFTLGYGYATLTLTTHDRGGITDVDLALARRIDEQ